MRASVVIRSKDEADRLRLTLASLARQTVVAEVVVVNDGSSDHTRAVVAEAELPVLLIDHATPAGRSAASNAGAERASGDLLIFQDGDTLAHPAMVERHLAAHRGRARVVARGETYHLRGTRLFADPETGRPRAGEEDRVARLPAAELERSLVTRADIRDRFERIHARAQPGIYPGAGPRRLFELEMAALRDPAGSQILWMAAAGTNQSVDRDSFRAVGGFDEGLTINEHRELALRLQAQGVGMAPANDAYAYHMTHRSGWRDPATEPDWEERFYQRHPLPAVALMSVFWASLSDGGALPAQARIGSLPELEAAAARCAGVVGLEAVRRAHLEACATRGPAAA